MNMDRKRLMESVIDYAQAYMDGTQRRKSAAKKMLGVASEIIVDFSSPNEFIFIAGRTDDEKIGVEIFLAIARKMGWLVSGPAFDKSKAAQAKEMVAGKGPAFTSVREFLSGYRDGTDFRNAVSQYSEEFASIIDANLKGKTAYAEDVFKSSRSPWAWEKSVAWEIVLAATRHSGLDVA